MIAALLTGLLLAMMQDTVKREQAGNVLFVRPAGWERTDMQDGRVMLVPTDLAAGEDLSIVILPGESTDTPRDWFDRAWSAVTRNMVVVGGGDVGGLKKNGYEILHVSAALEQENKNRLWVAFVVAAPGGRVDSLVMVANSENLFTRGARALNAVIDQIDFANLRSADSVLPEAPSPTVELDSAYTRLYFSRITGRRSQDYLFFFKDGIVYRGWRDDGFEGFDVAKGAAADKNGWYGTWKKTAAGIHIRWSNGSETPLRRDGKTLDDDATLRTAYVPISPSDGLTFDGTYTRDSGSATSPWIRFSRDGRFEEQGVSFAWISNRPQRESGRGRYAIRNFTLTLQYDEGPPSRIAFHVVHDREDAPPARVFLNTFDMERIR